MPVAVHHVEVELRRVNDEMVVKVIGVRHDFEKPAPFVERDFCAPAVPATYDGTSARSLTRPG
jgi:hypothetical protein